MRSKERIKHTLATMTLLGGFAFMATPASAQVSGGIYVNFGHPPAPVYEAVPVAPGPDYGWQRGAWVWDGDRYRWHRGHYVQRHGHGDHGDHGDRGDHGHDHGDGHDH